MSDTKNPKEDFLKNMDEESELNRKKRELETARVDVQYERLEENKKKLQAAKEGAYGTLTDEQAEDLARQNSEYLANAKKSLTFINPAFGTTIPFFAKNMILVGGKTGEGKSTAVANIVRRIIGEKNPATGKTCRVLVLTNEENVVDFYNRITCLFKGWHYVNHDLFTEEQAREMSEMIKLLRHRVTVIDDNHVPGGGATTTPEGIDEIFKNLLLKGEHYDAVILDYYQGITESSRDLTLNEYQAQRKLTQILEKYRKIYPAPIVVMAQMNPPEDPERPSPFQVRIQGTKLICTKATTIVEMLANRDELTTEFFFHKGRYAQSVGESVKVGYLNGLFVSKESADYLQHKRDRAVAKERKVAEAMDREIGLQVKKKVEEPANG